jgi:hypothetical protein
VVSNNLWRNSSAASNLYLKHPEIVARIDAAMNGLLKAGQSR